MERPFYASFAWAYDLFLDDPVGPWVQEICEVRPPPGALLDAGCGTGRHAMALTARGFEVVLADAAEALLVQARQRLPEARALLGDLSELKLNREIDVVACRGVLNDVIDDADRDAVLAAFARALRPGGAVVIDVREELATMARYAGGRRTLREAGGVVFTSEGVWQDGVVAVVERHEAQGRVAEHTAVFRPWSRDELRDRLVTAGFTVDTIATGRVEHRADRLIAIARWNG